MAFLIRREPVLVLAGFLNAAIAVVGCYATSLDPRQAAALVTGSTALTHLIAAALARPANVALIHGSLTTIAVGAAGFGVHLTPGQIGAVAVILTAVLPSLLREKVSPVVGDRPPDPSASPAPPAAAAPPG